MNEVLGVSAVVAEADSEDLPIIVQVGSKFYEAKSVEYDDSMDAVIITTFDKPIDD